MPLRIVNADDTVAHASSSGASSCDEQHATHRRRRSRIGSNSTAVALPRLPGKPDDARDSLPVTPASPPLSSVAGSPSNSANSPASNISDASTAVAPSSHLPHAGPPSYAPPSPPRDPTDPPHSGPRADDAILESMSPSDLRARLREALATIGEKERDLIAAAEIGQQLVCANTSLASEYERLLIVSSRGGNAGPREGTRAGARPGADAGVEEIMKMLRDEQAAVAGLMAAPFGSSVTSNANTTAAVRSSRRASLSLYMSRLTSQDNSSGKNAWPATTPPPEKDEALTEESVVARPRAGMDTRQAGSPMGKGLTVRKRRSAASLTGSGTTTSFGSTAVRGLKAGPTKKKGGVGVVGVINSGSIKGVKGRGKIGSPSPAPSATMLRGDTTDADYVAALEKANIDIKEQLRIALRNQSEAQASHHRTSTNLRTELDALQHQLHASLSDLRDAELAHQRSVSSLHSDLDTLRAELSQALLAAQELDAERRRLLHAGKSAAREHGDVERVDAKEIAELRAALEDARVDVGRQRRARAEAEQKLRACKREVEELRALVAKVEEERNSWSAWRAEEASLRAECGRLGEVVEEMRREREERMEEVLFAEAMRGCGETLEGVEMAKGGLVEVERISADGGGREGETGEDDEEEGEDHEEDGEFGTDADDEGEEGALAHASASERQEGGEENWEWTPWIIRVKNKTFDRDITGLRKEIDYLQSHRVEAYTRLRHEMDAMMTSLLSILPASIQSVATRVVGIPLVGAAAPTRDGAEATGDQAGLDGEVAKRMDGMACGDNVVPALVVAAAEGGAAIESAPVVAETA